MLDICNYLGSLEIRIIMKYILLVEDDPFIADIYATRLKEDGFTVDLASDGQECLDKIREKKPDLLVLDIVLPRIDGWEILEEIRKDNKLKDTKVIIISNLSQKSEVQKGMELGALKYLIKAYYTPAEIIQEVKKILNPVSNNEG